MPLTAPDETATAGHRAPPVPAPPVAPPRLARRLLDRDVDLLLAVARGRTVPAAWARPQFAVRVDAVRRQLAPVIAPDVLLASFAREALHARPWSARPSAVRVAYAVRAVELGGAVALPAWSVIAAAWAGSDGDGRFGPPRLAAQPGLSTPSEGRRGADRP